VIAGFAVDDLLAKPLQPAALEAALHRAGVCPPAPGEVWVVDDDPRARELMAATIGQLGLRASTYADGWAAVRDSGAARPVAVIVDLMMPGMSGFELIDRLRATEACRTVPIIVWTAKDLTSDERERLRWTAQAVVAKGARAGLPDVLHAVLPPPQRLDHGA
jgi:CheY-like chemotaxis protein